MSDEDTYRAMNRHPVVEQSMQVVKKLEAIEQGLKQAMPAKGDQFASAADVEHLVIAVADLTDLVRMLLRDEV